MGKTKLKRLNKKAKMKMLAKHPNTHKQVMDDDGDEDVMGLGGDIGGILKTIAPLAVPLLAATGVGAPLAAGIAAGAGILGSGLQTADRSNAQPKNAIPQPALSTPPIQQNGYRKDGGPVMGYNPNISYGHPIMNDGSSYPTGYTPPPVTNPKDLIPAPSVIDSTKVKATNIKLADGGKAGVTINAEHNELIVDPKNNNVLADLKNLPPHPKNESLIDPRGTLNLPKEWEGKMVIPKAGVNGREAFLDAKKTNDTVKLNTIYRNLQNKQQQKELGDQADNLDMYAGKGGKIHVKHRLKPLHKKTSQEPDDDDDYDFMKNGGTIKINPANKGKFNATKARTGETTEELTHSSDPVTRKRAVFAQNASHWKHAEGGPIKRYDQNSVIEDLVPNPDTAKEYDWNLNEPNSISAPQASAVPVTQPANPGQGTQVEGLKGVGPDNQYKWNTSDLNTNPMQTAQSQTGAPKTPNPYAFTPEQNLGFGALNNVGNVIGLGNALHYDRNTAVDNPYEKEGLSTLKNRSFNVDPVLASNRDTLATGRYGLRNSGAQSGGEYRSNLSALLKNKYKADLVAHAEKNNQDNLYKGQYAENALAQGERNRADSVRVQKDNLASKARSEDLTAGYAGQIGKNVTSQIRDNQRIDMLPTMFPNLDTDTILKLIGTGNGGYLKIGK